MAPHTARFHHAFVSSSLLSVLVTSSYVVMSLLPMSWRAKWGGGRGAHDPIGVVCKDETKSKQ